MVRLNWIRLASLTAFIGGALQLVIMLLQVQQFIDLQILSRVTRVWYAPWGYRWIAISPWPFFLITLVILYLFVVRRMNWLGWLSLVGVILAVLAIIISQLGIILTADPNCYPGILCREQNLANFALLRNIGIAGVFLASASLFLYTVVLVRRKFSAGWITVFFLLGLLTLHACIVIVELANPLPGFFKVEPVAITLGLIWAVVWLSIGILLQLKAVTYRRWLTAL